MKHFEDFLYLFEDIKKKYKSLPSFVAKDFTSLTPAEPFEAIVSMMSAIRDETSFLRAQCDELRQTSKGFEIFRRLKMRHA